jgi:hypothetical protein
MTHEAAKRRFVSIEEYRRRNGGSYQTIKSALDRGDLQGIRTEAGKWLIDTEAQSDPNSREIIHRLDGQERVLRALCKHLGVAI